MKKKNIIEIKAETKIGHVILEAGDYIQVLNEQAGTKKLDVDTFKSVIEKYKVGGIQGNFFEGKGSYLEFDKPWNIDDYDLRNMNYLFCYTKNFTVAISWNEILKIEQYEEKDDDVIIITTKGMFFYFGVAKKDLAFL